MIVTATSAANKCLYCVVAHGAILRIYEKKPLVADQVAVNYRKADITPRQRAMLDFAMKVCLRSHEIEEADFARCIRTASTTRTSGTSPRSPPSSACPTAWRASRTCCPTPSSTCGRVPREEEASQTVDAIGRSARLARNQSGMGTDFCFGKSTHTVVAPPEA
jgi:AhpD family alkylhydroperoxidase